MKIVGFIVFVDFRRVCYFLKGILIFEFFYVLYVFFFIFLVEDSLISSLVVYIGLGLGVLIGVIVIVIVIMVVFKCR